MLSVTWQPNGEWWLQSSFTWWTPLPREHNMTTSPYNDHTTRTPPPCYTTTTTQRWNHHQATRWPHQATRWPHQATRWPHQATWWPHHPLIPSSCDNDAQQYGTITRQWGHRTRAWWWAHTITAWWEQWWGSPCPSSPLHPSLFPPSILLPSFHPSSLSPSLPSALFKTLPNNVLSTGKRSFN